MTPEQFSELLENLKRELRMFVKSEISNAYEEAAYIAEMKSTNIAGEYHNCQDYDSKVACDWLGEVADELREKAAKIKKGEL